jgi:hypothetical protein
MASRPRRSAVARSTAVRSTTTGAGAASVSPASAVDNAADITRAREILSRFRCDRRVHSGDCMRDVAIASRARARDAIVDIKSQIFDGETMLAQTVATAARASSGSHDIMMPLRRRKAPKMKPPLARTQVRSGHAPRVRNTLIIMSYSPSNV